MRCEEHAQDVGNGGNEALEFLDEVFWVWNREDQNDSLDYGPAVVENASNNTSGQDVLEVEEGCEPDEMGAWLFDWVKLHATVALVSWDLSVSSCSKVVSSFSAVFGLNMHDLVINDLFLNGNALAIGVLDEVNIALIVLLCAETWNSHYLSLEVFAVETLRVLLSSDVGDLLTEIAFVGMSTVSVIVMGTPKLEVRFVSSGIVYTLALWFMKSREIKSNHNIITSLPDSVDNFSSIILTILCAVII